METKIFKSYGDFVARKNKSENGVSEEFAASNPDFQAQNKTNKGCWDCSDCSGCSGCSRCSDCSGCSRCSDCSDCSDCSGCSGTYPQDGQIKIPAIKNIHTKVLEAVKGGKLEMESWHSCNTTHCRGGWVITLAGNEGKDLEEKTSSEFAAMAIYSKSSTIKVSPVRFYENNEKAMADIERCALEESKLK